MRGSRAVQRRAFDRLVRGSEGGLAASARNPGTPGSLGDDPVFFAHRYAAAGDCEIAATVAALFAYGQVRVMARAIGAILDRLESSPRASLQAREHRAEGFARGIRYRFQRSDDVVACLEALADSVARWGGLGPALAHHAREAGDRRGAGGLPAAEAGLAAWVRTLRGAAGRDTPGLRHLFADPSTGSAVKRWRLLLRWMVRPADGIDLGLWSDLFSPADLVVPLDTHWIRIGTRLGLTTRRTPDTRMAAEITAALRLLDPADPLRFDLPVCHLGISGGCPPRLEPRHCAACPLRPACRTAAASGL